MNTKTGQFLMVALLALTGCQSAALAADKTDKTDKAITDGAPVTGRETTPAAGASPVAGRPGNNGLMPVYVPPRRGAPLARVGGGTRGSGNHLPFVSVITPEDTGLTSTPGPVLYWYLSEDMQTRFEFALIDENGIDPMLELTSDEKLLAGLNSVDLAQQGITLEPGVSYQWSVALVDDSGKRSGDIVSSGMIEYVALAPEQQAELANSSAGEAVRFFAREGYWYDAFSAISMLIDKDPSNRGLRRQRSALLEQIGLDEVAAAGML
jgi:hypothetical protein